MLPAICVFLASLQSPPEEGPRLEHFVLEIREGEKTREVGTICLRRRAIDGGMQLESDATFLREGSGRDAERESQRVLHVEHLGSASSRLVWREWGSGGARSLTAEWSSDGGILRLVEACGDRVPRESILAREGAVMPLYLVELAREGRVTSGRYKRFDPLSRKLEDVEVRTSYRAEDQQTEPEGEARKRSFRRRVEILREDGALAGRFEFRGTELESFQWQEGDLVARRTSAPEPTVATTPAALRSN